MDFQTGVVYDVEDTDDPVFQGYVILKEGKLYSTNLWSAEEHEDVQEQVKKLNHARVLAEFWPRQDDDDVIALLEDLDFEPIDMILKDVVNREASTFVWLKDRTGLDTGLWDEDKSDIVYESKLVPSDPVEGQMRMHKAQERVAEKRSQV